MFITSGFFCRSGSEVPCVFRERGNVEQSVHPESGTGESRFPARRRNLCAGKNLFLRVPCFYLKPHSVLEQRRERDAPRFCRRGFVRFTYAATAMALPAGLFALKLPLRSHLIMNGAIVLFFIAIATFPEKRWQEISGKRQRYPRGRADQLVTSADSKRNSKNMRMTPPDDL